MSTPETKEDVKTETRLATVSVARNGIQINTMDDLFRFAKAVVVAGLAPKGLDKPEAVFVAIQMGLEVGISPMAAIQNIAVVNGKPKFYGSMPLALVRASGLLEYIKESIEGKGDERKAVCITKRKGEAEPRITTFSVADAKQAGLWGTNTWAKYPERMLTYRARGFNLDDNFSDVLKGMGSNDAYIDLEPSAVTVTRNEDVTPAPLQELKTPLVEKKVDPKDFRATKAYQKMSESLRNGQWHDVECHFGTAEAPIKGMTLLEVNQLNPKIWERLLKWEPKLQENGDYNITDLALRAALDATQGETKLEEVAK
jgi:hypothetical protein